MVTQTLSPSGSARDNTAAFQAMLDKGGTIEIDRPGIYEFDGTLIITGGTELIFGAGVYIKRSKTSNGSFAFTNRGAFSRVYDENITIRGLRLITNGVEARANAAVYGLTGELSFFYVRGLRIFDFECLDLPSGSFGIHICTFEDIVIERVKIAGRKDGVHLGTGSKFVIRHGLFKTFDDPIALNAHDYAVSNPQMGWIEDGLIEDCYDMDDDDTAGFFCRILAGSWCGWREGMEIQNSDTVVHNGRLYRAFQDVDGKKYKSVTPPVHASGMETIDGINWVMAQENDVHNCGCRNIHFKDIHLQKKRAVAFSIHFDNDWYSRSYYPGSEAPVQDNLIFENIYFENEIGGLIQSTAPFRTIKLINSVMKNSEICLRSYDIEGLDYGGANILLSGTTFKDEKPCVIVNCGEKRACRLKIVGSVVENDGFCALTSGDVRVIESDIPIRAAGE